MLGPKRFSDLRRSLPGISANVLSQRVAELEASHLLRRRDLPPPASVQVYELTPWGYELEPIFQVLGRWAARSPLLPLGLPMSANSVILSMRTMFDPVRAAGLDILVDLRLGPERFRVRVADGTLEAARGEAAGPDATLFTDPDTLAALLYTGAPLEELAAAGALDATGELAALRRLLGLFPLPDRVAV